MRIPHEHVPRESKIPVSGVLTFTISLQKVWSMAETSWFNCMPDSNYARPTLNFFLFMFEAVRTCSYKRRVDDVIQHGADEDLAARFQDVDDVVKSDMYLRVIYTDNRPVGMQVFITIPEDDIGVEQVESTNRVIFSNNMGRLLNASSLRVQMRNDDAEYDDIMFGNSDTPNTDAFSGANAQNAAAQQYKRRKVASDRDKNLPPITYKRVTDTNIILFYHNMIPDSDLHIRKLRPVTNDATPPQSIIGMFSMENVMKSQAWCNVMTEEWCVDQTYVDPKTFIKTEYDSNQQRDRTFFVIPPNIRNSFRHLTDSYHVFDLVAKDNNEVFTADTFKHFMLPTMCPTVIEFLRYINNIRSRLELRQIELADLPKKQRHISGILRIHEYGLHNQQRKRRLRFETLPPIQWTRQTTIQSQSHNDLQQELYPELADVQAYTKDIMYHVRCISHALYTKLYQQIKMKKETERDIKKKMEMDASIELADGHDRKDGGGEDDNDNEVPIYDVNTAFKKNMELIKAEKILDKYSKNHDPFLSFTHQRGHLLNLNPTCAADIELGIYNFERPLREQTDKLRLTQQHKIPVIFPKCYHIGMQLREKLIRYDSDATDEIRSFYDAYYMEQFIKDWLSHAKAPDGTKEKKFYNQYKGCDEYSMRLARNIKFIQDYMNMSPLQTQVIVQGLMGCMGVPAMEFFKLATTMAVLGKNSVGKSQAAAAISEILTSSLVLTQDSVSLRAFITMEGVLFAYCDDKQNFNRESKDRNERMEINQFLSERSRGAINHRMAKFKTREQQNMYNDKVLEAIDQWSDKRYVLMLLCNEIKNTQQEVQSRFDIIHTIDQRPGDDQRHSKNRGKRKKSNSERALDMETKRSPRSTAAVFALRLQTMDAIDFWYYYVMGHFDYLNEQMGAIFFAILENMIHLPGMTDFGIRRKTNVQQLARSFASHRISTAWHESPYFKKMRQRGDDKKLMFYKQYAVVSMMDMYRAWITSVTSTDNEHLITTVLTKLKSYVAFYPMYEKRDQGHEGYEHQQPYDHKYKKKAPAKLKDVKFKPIDHEFRKYDDDECRAEAIIERVNNDTDYYVCQLSYEAAIKAISESLEDKDLSSGNVRRVLDELSEPHEKGAKTIIVFPRNTSYPGKLGLNVKYFDRVEVQSEYEKELLQLFRKSYTDMKRQNNDRIFTEAVNKIHNKVVDKQVTRDEIKGSCQAFALDEALKKETALKNEQINDIDNDRFGVGHDGNGEEQNEKKGICDINGNVYSIHDHGNGAGPYDNDKDVHQFTRDNGEGQQDYLECSGWDTDNDDDIKNDLPKEDAGMDNDVADIFFKAASASKSNADDDGKLSTTKKRIRSKEEMEYDALMREAGEELKKVKLNDWHSEEARRQTCWNAYRGPEWFAFSPAIRARIRELIKNKRTTEDTLYPELLPGARSERILKALYFLRRVRGGDRTHYFKDGYSWIYVKPHEAYFFDADNGKGHGTEKITMLDGTIRYRMKLPVNNLILVHKNLLEEHVLSIEKMKSEQLLFDACAHVSGELQRGQRALVCVDRREYRPDVFDCARYMKVGNRPPSKYLKIANPARKEGTPAFSSKITEGRSLDEINNIKSVLDPDQDMVDLSKEKNLYIQLLRITALRNSGIPLLRAFYPRKINYHFNYPEIRVQYESDDDADSDVAGEEEEGGLDEAALRRKYGIGGDMKTNGNPDKDGMGGDIIDMNASGDHNDSDDSSEYDRFERKKFTPLRNNPVHPSELIDDISNVFGESCGASSINDRSSSDESSLPELYTKRNVENDTSAEEAMPGSQQKGVTEKHNDIKGIETHANIDRRYTTLDDHTHKKPEAKRKRKRARRNYRLPRLSTKGSTSGSSRSGSTLSSASKKQKIKGIQTTFTKFYKTTLSSESPLPVPDGGSLKLTRTVIAQHNAANKNGPRSVVECASSVYSVESVSKRDGTKRKRQVIHSDDSDDNDNKSAKTFAEHTRTSKNPDNIDMDIDNTERQFLQPISRTVSSPVNVPRQSSVDSHSINGDNDSDDTIISDIGEPRLRTHASTDVGIPAETDSDHH